MKLPLPLCASYFSWTSAANYSRRIAPLCQKPLKNQPHWLVSPTSDLNISRPHTFFSSRALTFPPTSPLQSTIQTPSTL